MKTSLDSAPPSLGSPALPLAPVESWNATSPVLMKIASFLRRVLPRGKGAVPRWIGRTFGSNWQTFIQTRSGCKLAVDPRNLDLFVNIQQVGDWEPWVCGACIAALKDGEVMYDVGANVGVIANEVGLAKPHVSIFGFEPQPGLAELAVASAHLNGNHNVNVYSVAVGAHDGTISLHLPAHALHASTMASGEGGEQVVSCRLICLDDVVRNGTLPPPNLIKIDVEGGELNVLRGARWLIENYRPVIIFEANDNCARFGYSRSDLFELLTQLADYQFFTVAPGDVLAAPSDRASEFATTYEEVSPAAKDR